MNTTTQPTPSADSVAPAVKDKPKTVYIAGPMRGHERFNFVAFDDASALLMALGYAVINPAQLDRELGFNEFTHTLEDYFALLGVETREDGLKALASRNLNHVIQCDILCLLEGWEASLGATFERTAALYLQKEVRTLHGLLYHPVPPKQENADILPLEPDPIEDAFKVEAKPLRELTEEEFDECYTGIAHTFGSVLDRDENGHCTLRPEGGKPIALDSRLTFNDVWKLAEALEA